MSKLLIEWGKLERTETLEKAVQEKADKVLRKFPDATKLVVGFQVTNPVSSSGPATQKISMELRLPNHQDIRASKEGVDLYQLIGETEKALMAQKK